MTLKLHRYDSNNEILLNFEFIEFLEWDETDQNTDILLQSGDMVFVTETPEEIMEAYYKAYLQQPIFKSWDAEEPGEARENSD